MRLMLLLVCLLASPAAAWAVENVATSAYNETPPTDTDIPNWTTGWRQPAVQPTGFTSTTGWNYVGTVNGNSAVYLGNGWVLTAAHNGPGDFGLGGATYPMIAHSDKKLGTADMILFQVSPRPALPSLRIRATDPKAGSSPVAMLGWGHASGGRVPTWGYNNVVTHINQPITLNHYGIIFYSSDFFTLTQAHAGNAYQVVVGDSGGADFIFNTTTRMWELAGINEAVVSASEGGLSCSAMVQVNLYRAQIALAMAP